MRRVIVRIADKPGVHARTRAGYGAPRDARFLGACHQLELAGDPLAIALVSVLWLSLLVATPLSPAPLARADLRRWIGRVSPDS